MRRDSLEKRYEWHFLTRFPPKNLSKPLHIEWFRKLIKQTAAAHVDFEATLRHTALSVISDEDPNLVRQALQCLAHVGIAEDIGTLSALEMHDELSIVRDVKTCIFEIQHRQG
jgi:hypothetical protein